MQYCANVEKICEIEIFCPRQGELKRLLLFCQFLFDNNNTGSDFFHLFQAAYNIPNTGLVPTSDYYKGSQMFSFTMVTQSKLMALDNPIYRLHHMITSAYLRESYSPYATNAIKGDGVGRSKVSFHLTQLEYLARQAKRKTLHINPSSSRSEFRSHASLEAYFNRIIRNLKTLSEALEHMPYVPLVKNFHENEDELIAKALYNRNVYHRPFFPNGSRKHFLSLPMLNPLKAEEVEAISDQLHQEQLVVVDDFLNPEILEELYQYCVESTIWHVSDKSLFVGSYWNEGLSHPLMIEVAKEIARVFPFVGDLPLVHMWAYNFDPKKTERRSGIDMHMDAAVVNLNIWLTPDEANLDPESGGLIVWLKDLFTEENNPTGKKYSFDEVQDPEFAKAFLKGSEHMHVNIPFKRNRVVIFNSALWHTTDSYNFAKGHENRRINLTFLFGNNKNIVE
jgi:hypothetical protein